ncbi:hypothetical protein P3S68_015116 [Capsicum galapagoense]
MAFRTPLELFGQASEEESHRAGKIIQVMDIADFMSEENKLITITPETKSI